MIINPLKLLRVAGLFFYALANTATASGPPSLQGGPYVAYVLHGSIMLRSASGEVVDEISPGKSVNTFSLSNGLESIVFAPRGKEGYGGALYRYDLRSGKLSQLTKGLRLYPGKGTNEVYSNPDLSSDGQRIVFSVRMLPAGDAVEASGPFALMNLRTKSIRILAASGSSSEQLWPNGFPVSSYWSPSDRFIALNYDDGYEVVSSDGRRNFRLPSLPSNWNWATALGWLGRRCLVVQGGDGPSDALRNPALVVNMSSGTIEPLGKVLGMSSRDSRNLVAVTGQLRVREFGAHLVVDGLGHHWEVQRVDDGTSVIIVGGKPYQGVNRECL